MTNTEAAALLPAPIDLQPYLGGPMGASWYPAATQDEAIAMVPLVLAAEPRALHVPFAQRAFTSERPGPWGVFVSLRPLS